MTDLAELPGAEFDGYAIPTPKGEWSYSLDEGQVEFGPGWWPFYQRPHPSKPAAPTSVRLSPDTEYRSWRNEYVLVFNDSEHNRLCWMPTLRVWLRAQGMGGYVWTAPTVRLDIPTGTWTVDGDVPTEVADALDMKVTRVHAFIHHMRSLRRRGMTNPPHAYEAWVEQEEST